MGSKASAKALRRRHTRGIMREITVTKLEFDEFLFDDVTTGAPEGVDEMECALRVLRKLKDPTITEEQPLTEPQRAASEKAGRKIWPSRRLSVPEARFELEGDEHKLVLRRLKDAAKTHTILVMDEFNALLQRVIDAKEIKAGPRAVPDEPASAEAPAAEPATV